MKLRTKASLMVAVVVAVTLTTAEYFFHRDLESSIRQSIHNRVMVVSAAVSDSISHFIEEAHSDCKAIAANIPPEALENRRVDEIERYFKKMLAIYPKFQNGMFLLDTQGGLWADYPAHPQTRGKRFNYREYFKKTMTQARGIIGTPYSSARTGQPVLTFTALITGHEGNILGLLGCSVQLLSSPALGGIRNLKIGRSGYVYVFDESRRCILHPDDSRVLQQDVPKGANKLAEAALAGWEGVGETVNSRGVAMLLSLRHIPGTTWIVGAQLPLEDAFQPVVSSHLKAMLGTSLGVLLAIILIIGAMRHITNPLEQLRQATLELGHQGVEQSLADIRSRDEIGELAESFRAMSLKLHRSMESMKKVGVEWKLTFDSVRDAICLVDRQRRIVRLNRAAESLLQLKQHAVANGPTFDQRLAEVGWRVRDGHALAAESEVVITNGKSYFELVSTPLNGESGQAGGCIITARDITRRLLTEQEKDKLRYQLLQAQKMEAVGTLAGGIAHDFNNILGSIMGYSELALDDMRQGITSPGNVEQVLKSSHRAKALVQQILTFSRKTESLFKTMDLNQAVARTMPIIKSTIPKMITVDVKCAPDLKMVSGDANQIEQVIVNLASNAKDAMPEGGALLVETGNLHVTPENNRDHPVVTPGQYVQLIVSDSGEGMDQETLGHIFEPFFTTKQVGRGTGLGLATVYGIVQSHQGHITCQSKPGAGTTFVIYLPASEIEELPDEPEEHAAEILLQGKETILLVDDEETIREIVQKSLQGRGYHTFSAKDGEEALQIYARKQDSIDLVVLDISMPGMGGFRCMQKLLALNSELKIIIASGYAQDLPNGPISVSGAAGYIAKPFKAVELLRMVREVLDSPGPDKAADRGKG